MQQTYRTILIDDEPPARQRLKDLLSKYNQLFQIIAEAENACKAY